MTTLKDVIKILRVNLQTHPATCFGLQIDERMAELVEAAQALREACTLHIGVSYSTTRCVICGRYNGDHKDACAVAALDKLEHEP